MRSESDIIDAWDVDRHELTDNGSMHTLGGRQVLERFWRERDGCGGALEAMWILRKEIERHGSQRFHSSPHGRVDE